MIKIAPLADHPDCIPILARWFRDEWPNYYAARALADIEQDFHDELNRSKLPLRLDAFNNNELAGTVVLRHYAIASHPEYSPGLGGLFVAPAHRRQGIATELIRGAASTAKSLGHSTPYSTTSTAGAIFERLNWLPLATVQHGNEHFKVYQWRATAPL